MTSDGVKITWRHSGLAKLPATEPTSRLVRDKFTTRSDKIKHVWYCRDPAANESWWVEINLLWTSREQVVNVSRTKFKLIHRLRLFVVNESCTCRERVVILSGTRWFTRISLHHPLIAPQISITKAPAGNKGPRPYDSRTSIVVLRLYTNLALYFRRMKSYS
jgi:hypothetical protein